MRRTLIVVLTVAASMWTLAWLRDPAWLAQIESGFSRWQIDASGRPYRWTGGRASFFVPAGMAEVRIPLRLPMEPGDWPVVASIAVDDRPADRFRIASSEWHMSRLRLPPPGSRRLRRIDIHVDRTRPGNRGVQVGEVELIQR